MFSDYREHTADIVSPNTHVRSLGGTLSLERLESLFADNMPSSFQRMLSQRGKQSILYPFRISRELRTLAANAVSCKLMGSLRRMYIEGLVIQIFALIFHDEERDVQA